MHGAHGHNVKVAEFESLPSLHPKGLHGHTHPAKLASRPKNRKKTAAYQRRKP